jgi:hypothetical protein
MKRFTTNFFNFSKSLTLIFVFALLAYGCQKELIRPENNQPTGQNSGVSQVVRPDLQCGNSVMATLNDGANSLGTIEMLNDDQTFYMIFEMGIDQFIDEIKVYSGDANSAPLDADGNILLEGFPYQYLLSNPASEYTFMIPAADHRSCDVFAVWARVSTRDMFGQVISTQEAWISGTPLSNGFCTPYCLSSCATVNKGIPTIN